MLNEKIKEKIKEVDILTDFDGTMIKEESTLLQAYSYFFNSKNKLHFMKDIFEDYRNYKKSGDVSFFYALFKGCPVNIIDNVVNKCHQSRNWNKLIEKLRPQKIGIVSRNRQGFIIKYLDNFNRAEINITAANKPEIENGIYTGKVEIIVNNNNLIDFVKEKDYICGKDEIKILEKFGIYPKKTDTGLYICSKEKIF